MDSFEAFKDAVEAKVEYRNHPTVWGMEIPPQYPRMHGADIMHRSQAGVGTLTLGPHPERRREKRGREDRATRQRLRGGSGAGRGKKLSCLAPDRHADTDHLTQETSLAIKEGSADGTIQNAKDAATEAVRQKVSAKPHSVTDIVANLPSMSDQIAEEVLSDQAAQTAKAAATDAVHQKVFAIHELVENILIHLPPKTVFGMQRVCKSFANALRMAPQIREKLHLKRRDTDQRHILHDDMTLNPFFEMDPSLKVSTGSTRATIQMRDQVPINYASSMLDTYLYDIPCGRI
jgi:hypothetical protein